MKHLAVLALAFAFPAPFLCSAAPRPNIVLIMSDDMGFSDIGCYGGEIDTPVLDKLAANGLRFTQFYNTARCCPTRASLLSGLYPHQAGIGWMMTDRGHDGYRGDLNRNCLTIAEALRSAGYGTYMAGKWHVSRHTAPDGPKDNWPRQRGFDRFYGTIHGAGSLWDPNSLTRDNTQIAPDSDPEYQPEETWFYTDAISDQTARYIREHVEKSPDKPFFCYVSYTAAHWPMHAREKTIAKYKGRYDAGYEVFRQQRLARMKKLGLVAQDTGLSAQAMPWGSVENEAWELRCMEVYAAMVDEMDIGIGRIVDTIEKAGKLDNTLIFYLQDNGGCAENYGRGGNFTPRPDKPTLPPMAKGELQTRMQPKQTRDGYPVRTGPGVMPGPADTYIGYGKGWANVSNTPFREYKHWVHEGGISTPLIAHWPKGIARKGELDHQPGHLIDIMATCADLAGVTYPREKDGREIKPLEGRSLDVAFKGGRIEREALFWEHEGNCAIRKGNWKLVRKENRDWELYDISVDRIETNDLAKEKPDLARQLASAFQAYADRANVSPVGTWRGNRKPRKNAFNKQERFELKSGDALSQEKGPNIAGRGLRIEGTVRTTDPNGVIVAQGGDAHGFALILVDRKLQFLTCVDGTVSRAAMSKPAPAGEFPFLARMKPDGSVQLHAGRAVMLDQKVKPVRQMPIDGLNVGSDPGGTVGDYEAPFELEGDIKLVLELLPKRKKARKSASLIDRREIDRKMARRGEFAVSSVRLPSVLPSPQAAPQKDKPNGKKTRRQKGPMAPIVDDPRLPRVLLIGDSISIGYTLPVRELLKDVANVHRPPANCASTKHGLQGIEKWLGDGKWDVIHFNWGLHDLKYMGPNGENLADPKDPKNGQQVPIDRYEKNLDKLVQRLEKTGAKLIWRNTTPVPDGAKGRVVGDSAKYNDAARRVMETHGIPIHDLYAFAKPRWKEIGREANVHFTPAGSKKLAEEVAKVIRTALSK